jgi:hypothetical protein
MLRKIFVPTHNSITGLSETLGAFAAAIEPYSIVYIEKARPLCKMLHWDEVRKQLSGNPGHVCI